MGGIEDSTYIPQPSVSPDREVSASQAPKAASKGDKPSLSLEVLDKPEGISFKTNFGTPRLEGPEINMSEIMAVIRELSDALSHKRLQSSRTSVTFDANRLSELHKENAKKFAEIAKKIHKAQHESLIGKIFGWIGAIASLVASVIATAVTGGAAAPLLAASIMGVGMMTMQETGAMDKLTKALAQGFTKMLEDCGVSKKNAEKIGGILAVATIAAVAIGVQIVAAVASGGASAESSAYRIALQVSKIVNQVVGAGTMLGSGGVQIDSARAQKSAADTKVELTKNKADLAVLQSDHDQTAKDMQKILDAASKLNDEITQVMINLSQGEDAVISHMKI